MVSVVNSRMHEDHRTVRYGLGIALTMVDLEVMDS